jgi:hypothetical protein
VLREHLADWLRTEIQRQLLRLLVVAATGSVAPVPVVPAGDADDLDLVGASLVQLNPVDGGVEAVVVGAKGLEHLPDDLVLLVVKRAVAGPEVGLPS